jgi:hypothetical protein
MISELRKQYGLGDGGAASDSDCDGEGGGGGGGAAELAADDGLWSRIPTQKHQLKKISGVGNKHQRGRAGGRGAGLSSVAAAATYQVPPQPAHPQAQRRAAPTARGARRRVPYPLCDNPL